MTYLLDTNVVSELRRPEREPRVAEWMASVHSHELHVSVLVLGELRDGIERLRRRGDELQANALDGWFANVREAFGDRSLPISSAVAERWGRLNAERPLPVVDGLMAATALVHDLAFVTRDAHAVTGTGVRVLDPWRL